MFQEAEIVPEFKIQTDKQEFILNKTNQNFTVIFFFPRANTSGCTKEASEFSEIINEFRKMNTRVIGISKDTVEQQKKFREKHNLKCELGSDIDGSICNLFSVWVEKSMYGKKYMGIQRSTFLIDKDCKIIKTWPKVKVPNHAKEVLSVISNY